MSPERVDKEGVKNVAQAATEQLQRKAQRVQTSQVLRMSSRDDLAKWKVHPLLAFPFSHLTVFGHS